MTDIYFINGQNVEKSKSFLMKYSNLSEESFIGLELNIYDKSGLEVWVQLKNIDDLMSSIVNNNDKFFSVYFKAKKIDQKYLNLTHISLTHTYDNNIVIGLHFDDRIQQFDPLMISEFTLNENLDQCKIVDNLPPPKTIQDFYLF